MTFGVRRLAAAFLLLLLACANHVTRDRWQHMSDDAKRVYIASLIGGEKAKHAKGGTGHTYSRPAETYVKAIDDAYARGDKRDPAAIFAGLADRP